MPPRLTGDYQTLDLQQWKDLAAQKKAPTDVRLVKSYAGVVVRDASDPGKGPLRIRITTAQRDRDRDTISAGGWDLTNFLANPVVLFAHRSRELPIAKDNGLTIDGDGITGSPEFCPEEMNPLGPMVERMLRGGFLNAASVGFLPKTWQINEEERGYDFLTQELLEYSIVPVPANPGALVEARSAGIDLSPLKGWIEEILDETYESPMVLIPRELLEASYAIVGLTGKRVTSVERAAPTAVADIDRALGQELLTQMQHLTERVKVLETSPPGETLELEVIEESVDDADIIELDFEIEGADTPNETQVATADEIDLDGFDSLDDLRAELCAATTAATEGLLTRLTGRLP